MVEHYKRCPKGHLQSPENVYVYKSGRKKGTTICNVCRKEREKKRHRDAQKRQDAQKRLSGGEDALPPQKALKALKSVESPRLELFLGNVADLALRGILTAPEKIEKASAKELMQIASTALEKRALLRGEPTSIVSHEDRRQLNELIPALVREAERRGLTIDGEMQDVTPE